VGTRKNAVQLRFSMQMKINENNNNNNNTKEMNNGNGNGYRNGVHNNNNNHQHHAEESVTIESELSNPFIVITNECQWSEAEGTLIKKEAFGGHLEVPWPQFANTFHVHFVRATRQDVNRPSRTLSSEDMKYLHERWFASKATVTVKDFEKFWKWFGKSLHLIRYQKQTGNFWKNGFIYGFITKEGVGQALINQRPGSFLVRWSENHPGSFAVGYKHMDQVKHYLVKPEDISGPKKSLPDFLYGCPQFVYILKLSMNGLGKPQLTSYRKETALESYIQHRGPTDTAAGYDELPKSSTI